MGGSVRFLTLITTTPYSFLTPRSAFFIRLARNSRFLTSRLPSLNPNHFHRSLISFSPIRAIQSESFHSQSNVFRDETFSGQFASAPNWYHPWPEWSRFVEYVRQFGYFERVVDGDAWGFAPGDNFSSPEFYHATLACLEFARDRDNLLGYLSRSDIRVVVENGSAYLFRDAEMLRSKMKGLFGIKENGAMNLDRPTMVDLMKFLISSANIRPVSSADGYQSNEQIVVASVRNLLSELANLNFGALQSDYPGSVQTPNSDRYGQAPLPQRQHIEMKKGDWICPKCTFMNFARNMKCLECEEARPRRQLTNGEWECPQCDFFNYGRNMVCLRCDCKRPGELTLSPAHPQSTNSNRSGMGIQQTANEKTQWWSGNGSQLNNSDSNQRVDDDDEFPEIMPLRKGVNRFVVSTRKTPLERRLANAQAQRDNEDASGGMNNNNSYGHVPFVPLPPDMFSTKPHNNVNEMGQGQTNASHTSQGDTSRGSTFNSDVSGTPIERRVSELNNVTDLASAIPDEDFPELMPMRKGENRFVVSQKNDRSLTTPLNKRRAAMEQPSDSKYVPFVPFPPDYFAKKDQQSQAEPLNSNSSCLSSYNDTKAHPDASNRSSTFEHSPSSNSINTWSSNKASGNSAQDFKDGYIGRSSSTQNDIVTNSVTNSQKEHATISDGWSGKSLEGSAVTEIDPLDMSEEAKAERWFRRAAQIKDISELSQIPDEDFPSIMPMRKGVNRFVVSKRKTPLERRLTSPQYRRNLPVVESDPTKTPNDSN